ncbi:MULTISPECIES: ATP-binding protein [Ramlibacter]|uniref:histidine kinase n=1 Tax=Ramlibacter aquaticus TaxID=2780094 RepID=A0ABR9SKU0_9BURK|nr:MULTISPECIES: ATP-binding protein [Ramlibacter]MBE7942764.1 HAMP domain-containing protein [Ramlibacter aquaticus]
MRAMSLRLKVNLIVGAVILLMVMAGIALQLNNVRRSVNEEIEATNRVTVQLLSHVGLEYGVDNPDGLVRFFRQLGRVRANNITLADQNGAVLYRSPPPTYKQGREAPRWFTQLMLPPSSRQVVRLPNGAVLSIEAEPSRSILDGFDDLVALAAAGGAALVAVNLVLFWALGRALRPFPRIVDGLNRLEAGDFETRLPRLPGREAAAIGEAFNRMLGVLRDNMDNRQRAFQAEQRLSDSRQLADRVEDQVDAERREIARMLHDELGQSITAIRSLAMSVLLAAQGRDASAAQAARLIVDEAGRLHDQMRGLLPRLATVEPGADGLDEALADLLLRVRSAHPGVAIELGWEPAPAPVDGAAARVAYRVVQEGLTNALRHGQPRRIAVRLCPGDVLRVQVSDDGAGPAGDWRDSTHFGLRWLRERAESLGGRLSLSAGPAGGAVLEAALPRQP